MLDNPTINELQRRAGQMQDCVTHISESVFSYLNDHNYPISGDDYNVTKCKTELKYRSHYTLWDCEWFCDTEIQIGICLRLEAYEKYDYLSQSEYVNGLNSYTRTMYDYLDEASQNMHWTVQNQIIGASNAVILQGIKSEANIMKMVNGLRDGVAKTSDHLSDMIAMSSLMSDEYTDKQVQDLKTHIEGELAASYLTGDELVPLFQGVKDYIDDNVTTSALNTASYVDTKIDEVNTNVDGLESYMVNMIGLVYDDIDDRLKGLDSLIDSNYASLVSYMNNAVSPLYTKIDSEVTNLTTYVNGLVNQTVDEFAVKLANVNTYIDDSINQTVNIFDEKVTNLTNYVNENLTNITNLLDGKVEGLYSYIDSKILHTVSNLTGVINTLKSSIDNRITLEVNNLSSLVTGLDDKISERITNEVNTLNTNITLMNTTLISNIEDVRGELLEKLALSETNMISKVGEMIESSIDGLVENVIDPLRDYIIELDKWAQGIFEILSDPALLFAWVTETDQSKWNQIRYLFQLILIQALAIEEV